MSRSFHRPSKPAYYIEDYWISNHRAIIFSIILVIRHCLVKMAHCAKGKAYFLWTIMHGMYTYEATLVGPQAPLAGLLQWRWLRWLG